MASKEPTTWDFWLAYTYKAGPLRRSQLQQGRASTDRSHLPPNATVLMKWAEEAEQLGTYRRTEGILISQTPNSSERCRRRRPAETDLHPDPSAPFLSGSAHPRRTTGSLSASFPTLLHASRQTPGSRARRRRAETVAPMSALVGNMEFWRCWPGWTRRRRLFVLRTIVFRPDRKRVGRRARNGKTAPMRAFPVGRDLHPDHL